MKHEVHTNVFHYSNVNVWKQFIFFETKSPSVSSYKHPGVWLLRERDSSVTKAFFHTPKHSISLESVLYVQCPFLFPHTVATHTFDYYWQENLYESRHCRVSQINQGEVCCVCSLSEQTSFFCQPIACRFLCTLVGVQLSRNVIGAVASGCLFDNIGSIRVTPTVERGRWCLFK